MKLELKDFQTNSARAILDELDEARVAAAKGKLQAVVLSAPTGSGKTITVAAVIDWLYGGEEGIVPRPATTFLWLSDSPELNAQSKAKLLSTCDHIPFHKLVTVDSESFDEASLHPGYVYFINTQLLGKDKLLTKGGDKKTFTFWQTVANTVRDRPQDFILIIDEAHRGAGVSERARKPIMQKFVTGSDVDALPPVPLVLGMSATPHRFTELLGNSSRTQRPVNITPDMVRQSGLLKDLIVVTCPKTSGQSDLTLLENAAARWKEFRERWEAYCTTEKEKSKVTPVLVVQVQDGNQSTLTNTPLHDVVRVIEREMGQLAPNQIVHCFQDKDDIQYGGRIIRRIEASRIQDSSQVKVVLFKTALTTGWDCPRAEVMMSFRRAQDPTSIAQLVGRMIRTPLARRIESDELLNTVELFLPHYDADALEGVLAQLRNPEEHEGLPIEVATVAVEYPRNSAYSDVFDHLSKLQTYSVDRAPKMRDIKRALRLAGMLVHEGIDPEADERLRSVLTAKLKELLDRYAKTDSEWDRLVRQGGEVEVDVAAVAIGEMNVTGHRTTRLVLSEENVEHLFDEAGRILATGEGLHRTFWKVYHNRDNPNATKLELFATVRKPETAEVMEKVARSEFERMWTGAKAEIKKLSASDRAAFQHLIQASGKAIAHDWELPERIIEKPGKQTWKHHLFADAQGDYTVSLNGWETEFLEWAQAQSDFACWLLNVPRKDWALCVPYELGGEKPFYPDLIIIRRKDQGFEVDILEPHDDSRTDTWAKVKGLAKFADEHHLDFGRLLVGRKKAGKLQIINVAEGKVREKARTMNSPNDLSALFGDI